MYVYTVIYALFCCGACMCNLTLHSQKEKKWNDDDRNDVGNRTPYIYMKQKQHTHARARIHNLTKRCDVEKKRGDEAEEKEEKYMRMK